MTTGPIVNRLLAAGWCRDNYTPPDSIGLCGCISDDPMGTGECYHHARWTKQWIGGKSEWSQFKPLCAQHALRRQEYEDYRIVFRRKAQVELEGLTEE